MSKIFHFGLIGYPLSHSFSQRLFSDFFKQAQLPYRYGLFPLPDLNAFPELLERFPTLTGLNVTLPYKEKILSFVHCKDAAVDAIGACNCLKIDKGCIKAFNTDVYGFLYELKGKASLLNGVSNALILGSGGAAKAVRYALSSLNIAASFVSRTKTQDSYLYTELSREIIAKHRLIVQATPLGMYPNTQDMPAFPCHFLTQEHIAYDLIYNPQLTLFLKRCAHYGAHIIGGTTMLQQQALASWEIWKP